MTFFIHMFKIYYNDWHLRYLRGWLMCTNTYVSMWFTHQFKSPHANEIAEFTSFNQ